jgi:hypothetical protein
MSSYRRRHWHGLTTFVAIAALASLSLLTGTHAVAAKVPLSIKVVRNHFVNGSGRTIRLLGVNRPSSQFGCVDGFGYDDGHFNDSDAAAIASWGANAVRIPLNEDCWLGINGQPNSNEGADPPLTRDGYRLEIENYVHTLAAHGIYAILDLDWTAPGSQVALEQQPMPDFDNSPAFWTSVASAFKTNRTVVFDLFSAPFDATDRRSGTDTNVHDKVTWNCWKTGTKNGSNGGVDCFTAARDENGARTTTYRVAGMQTLVNAVRNTGAKQPIMIGGLDFANDLGDNDHGQQWLTHRPHDPVNQEAASFHNYMGRQCDTATCWKNSIAPIAAHVPVVTGEFAENDFDESHCQHKTPTTFDAQYMNWADSAGVSYLATGWIVETEAEKDANDCHAFFLINSYSTHTPAQPNGVAVHTHLHVLSEPPVTITQFRAAVRAGNSKVAFALRSQQTCAGTLTGKTTHSYVVAKSKPHQVSLGSVKVSLKAATSHVVVLTLSNAAHKLLVAKRSLQVQITINLTSRNHRPTVVQRTTTLKAVTNR